MRKAKTIILLLILLLGFKAFTCSSITGSAATSTSQAAVVRTSGGNLNVRASASSNGNVISSLPNKSYLTLINKTGNWWRIEYSRNKYGYVSSDYIIGIQSSVKKVSLSSGSLNVRTQASQSSTIKDKLSNNDFVLELNTTNGFSKVIYNGTKIGYVASRYLSGNNTYSNISLNVTNYKQFDSRWANKTIGNSGSTMKQIGCATTALAMTESYRLGYSITPLQMLSKLSYTNSGSLYWPSNYYSYTSSSYLTKLYSLLKAGKPALIGFKTSTGKQHWVVVTGYIGSNSLQASNFTINDPGSSTRTKLSEVIANYPIFYKIMHY